MSERIRSHLQNYTKSRLRNKIAFSKISEKIRKAKIEFAKARINWNVAKWRNIFFSDETKFDIKVSDAKNCNVGNPINKRFDLKYCKGTVEHGGGNFMTWKCFSFNGVGLIH